MVLAGAVLAFALSTAGLFFLVEPIPSFYFPLAWWSYLAAVDDLNRRWAGRSLLSDSPREFLRLALTSAAWWTLFEALNLRLGNWYYVMDAAQRWQRYASGIVSFATVLPAIVETEALLANLGWLRSARVAAVRWSRAKDAGMVGLGLACFLLPLLWPDLFFPLTWGSFAFLLEPWNRRHARASFLRDLEAGEAGPFLRTLLAGLACGVLWETWNFWARTKWVYTVPGFEGWKVFEMPLLGFLGFPPFAVECLVLLRFLGTMRERLARRRHAVWVGAAGWSAAAVLGGVVFEAADRITVDSFYVPVAALEVLPTQVRARLVASGLTSPERALRALGTAEDTARWGSQTGLSPQELARARDQVALVLHCGLGADRTRQLEALGIRSVADLARWDAAGLASALRRQQTTPRDRFLERRARVWVGHEPSAVSVQNSATEGGRRGLE